MELVLLLTESERGACTAKFIHNSSTAPVQPRQAVRAQGRSAGSIHTAVWADALPTFAAVWT